MEKINEIRERYLFETSAVTKAKHYTEDVSYLLDYINNLNSQISVLKKSTGTQNMVADYVQLAEEILDIVSKYPTLFNFGPKA
jgi:hypothetical protein